MASAAKYGSSNSNEFKEKQENEFIITEQNNLLEDKKEQFIG